MKRGVCSAMSHAAKILQAQSRLIRKAITVAELCDRYMADAKAGLVLTRFGSGKKPSTLAIDEGRVARHIKPVLGSLAVASVTAADIRNLRDAVAAGKTACRCKNRPPWLG